jgi:3-hydroxyacyl-[acyl-carrier-protein] dehydratase
VGIDGARFKKPVVPGDQLVLEVTQGRVARGLGKFTGVARVSGVVVAEAEMMCALREIEEK